MTTKSSDMGEAVSPGPVPDGHDVRDVAGERVLNDEVLNRRVRSPFTGFALCVAIILIVALALRILKLDVYLLSAREGRWASDGWSIFTGSPLPASQALPEVAPFYQVANAVSFFLFGVTDATARIASAMLGFGIVVLIFSFRPFVSRSHLAAMATMAAISPTLVFASRTIDPSIAIAFFSLLTLVALLRSGASESDVTQAGWSLGVGLGCAGMLASGVNGVTAMLALGVGVFAAAVTDPAGHRAESRGVVRSGVVAIGSSVKNTGLVVGGFVFAVVVFFSRMLTDFSALTGLFTTFGDWGAMMVSRSTSIPASFYFWVLLLYEILAVVFAVLAVIGPRPDANAPAARRQSLSPILFGMWFFAALLLHTFASGREADQAVLVVLPLVLLGGLGLGDVLSRIDAAGFWHSRSWGMPILVLGLGIGLVTSMILVARATDPDVAPNEGAPSWLVVLMIGSIVLITLGAMGALFAQEDGQPRPALADPILMMVAAALALFTIVTTSGLAFERADDGTELLARNVPTEDSAALIDRINQVSRDLSVAERSNIDPTGRYGLEIVVDPDVAWPFAWYFRDYPFMRVTPPAGWNENVDVAISTDAEGMDTYGLTPQQSVWIIRPPQTHVDLDAGSIFGRFLETDTWADALGYLFNRDIENPQEPVFVTVGYSNRVNSQLNPNFGPFDLFASESPGPGNGQGQLNQPAGIDVSPDGEMIYVLNAGNQRIDRFQRDGTFVGVWDGAVDPVLALSWNVNQGGTGLLVADDGFIYIADTWNHTVVVVDESGTIVRQLGQRGVLTDTTDAGDPQDSPGLFFGPRDIAVTNERIFVTDTGNERVQVFGRDGTFLNAFGGYGTDPGQLIEPTGIDIGPDGNVWVADSGNARIQVFTIEGAFVEEIAVSSWEGQLGIDRLNALRFGPDGVLYVTSPLTGAVEAYDGTDLVMVGNVPSMRVGGIAVTADGTLLLTDVNTAEVRQIEPELPEGFGIQPEVGASPVATPEATPAATPERD